MEHASNSPPSSPDINKIVGSPLLSPKLGPEYQVEVPSMLTDSERLQLLSNPADSDVVQDNSLSFAFGLPFPVIQIPNEGERKKPTTVRFVMKGDRKSVQLCRSKNYVMVPGTLSESWTDADMKSFLLGLFIFGKNFMQIKRFLENKEMREILSFYYGKFYKSNEYSRWSGCRKLKGRKCVTGRKLFTGQRQNELLSRLIPQVSEESRDQLFQISKSFTECRVSLEKYISSLKSAAGLSVLVEAVGIGKEKEDLTKLVVEPAKKNRMLSAPKSKAWSSLGPDDIVKFLSGGFQPSEGETKDIFWEAVWPRLLARGWHFEKPKNHGYVSTKDYLVFLIPGVKKFSRRSLVKGDHYFDSVSDLVSKVVAEPNLLLLGEEAKGGSCNEEEPEKGLLNKDDRSDYHRHCYLNPQASTFNSDPKSISDRGDHQIEADDDDQYSNENKMMQSHQNQKNSVSDDNQQKRPIKCQPSQGARLDHSKNAAKRRRLNSCAKAQGNRVLENSSGSLVSGDQCLTSDTNELVEKPSPRTLESSNDDGSKEQQHDINLRRQSTRNRPLSVRALESMANELLHVQSRKKRKDIQTHNDAFGSCRKARTGVKTRMNLS